MRSCRRRDWFRLSSAPGGAVAITVAAQAGGGGAIGDGGIAAAVVQIHRFHFAVGQIIPAGAGNAIGVAGIAAIAGAAMHGAVGHLHRPGLVDQDLGVGGRDFLIEAGGTGIVLGHPFLAGAARHAQPGRRHQHQT